MCIVFVTATDHYSLSVPLPSSPLLFVRLALSLTRVLAPQHHRLEPRRVPRTPDHTRSLAPLGPDPPRPAALARPPRPLRPRPLGRRHLARPLAPARLCQHHHHRRHDPLRHPHQLHRVDPARIEALARQPYARLPRPRRRQLVVRLASRRIPRQLPRAGRSDKGGLRRLQPPRRRAQVPLVRSGLSTFLLLLAHHRRRHCRLADGSSRLHLEPRDALEARARPPPARHGRARARAQQRDARGRRGRGRVAQGQERRGGRREGREAGRGREEERGAAGRRGRGEAGERAVRRAQVRPSLPPSRSGRSSSR